MATADRDLDQQPSPGESPARPAPRGFTYDTPRSGSTRLSDRARGSGPSGWVARSEPGEMGHASPIG